ncbi:MAG: hypothetical protein ABSG51_16335 [Terracidiphilus sp.]|jgi:hypothetical protein
MSESRIPKIITNLYALVDELEILFPERRFTLDGHLVGSIGEVVAKFFYKLELLPIGNQNTDARTLDGSRRTVQIKLTAGDSVSFADYDDHPDLLIVLRIDRKAGFNEIYNGKYPVKLLAEKKPTKRLVKALSLRRLGDEQSHIERSLDDEGRIGLLNNQFPRGNA